MGFDIREIWVMYNIWTTHRSNNVTTLSSHNSEIRESILIFFGKNVTEKVGSQQALYFPTT